MSDRQQCIGAAAGVLLMSICIASWHLHRNLHVWTPDGGIYLRMALQDRGVSPTSARRAANHFMLDEGVRQGSIEQADRGLYTEHAPQFYVDQLELFRNRPIYPLLAAQLYPAFGPVALKIVSAVAYVLAVSAMFLILTALTSALRAALGALLFGTQQVVLNVAALPLTDELALFTWICALAAVIAYQRRPNRFALIGIVLASIALTLTRPAFFLPLGAAAGSFSMLRRSFSTRIALAPLIAALPAAIVYFAYTASAHGPGIVRQLSWQYALQHSQHAWGTERGPLIWYGGALATDAYQTMILAVPNLGGILLILLAVLGASLFRTDAVVRIAIVSGVAICSAIFVNPLGVERPVLLPMAPLIVLLAVRGLKRIHVSRTNASLTAK